MFTIEKDGYNRQEVKEKFTQMLIEISSLRHSNEEKDRLNLGIATALQKSKEIEASSRNLNDLKIKKIIIVFQKLERSFLSFANKYPQFSEMPDLRDLFDEFSNSISENLNTNPLNKVNTFANSTIQTENDPIRLLLNKMSTYVKPKQDISRKASLTRKDTKTKDPYFDKPSQIKPIANLELENNEDYETIADKFLESNTTIKNAYEKKLAKLDNEFPSPNESGFDLKEAVNPKIDLDEIMKAFNINEE